MKYLALTFATAVVLSTCGCASSLPSDLDTTVEKVDQGAFKLEAAIKFVRENVKPYAQLAVSACGATPLNVESCKEIDALAGRLFAALDKAQAALDLYKAGRGDFIDAYEAVESAIALAEDYAQKVIDLVQRASV